MTVTRSAVLDSLGRIALPDGGDLVSRDLVRALVVEAGAVRFVIEAPDPETAQRMAPVRAAAEAAVEGAAGSDNRLGRPDRAWPGVEGAEPARSAATRKPQAGPQPVPGVKRILAIGSGKGGVGKSTVSSNLAVALARAGRRVGLLDADIYGPSQPRMMGVTERPVAPGGKTIIPLKAHGVTMMSIGLLAEGGRGGGLARADADGGNPAASGAGGLGRT